MRAGAAQELPRADRRRDRAGVEVESALDEHQVHQVGRQALLVEHLAEQLHVAARALEPALELRAARAGEEIDVAVDVGIELRLDLLDRRGVEHPIGGVVAGRGRARGVLGILAGRVTQAIQLGLQVLQLTMLGGVGIGREFRFDGLERPIRRGDRTREITRLALCPGGAESRAGLHGSQRGGRDGVGFGPDRERFVRAQ